MKKSTVSKLLSITLALSMTLGSGSVAVFADDAPATEEIEAAVVTEEDAEAAEEAVAAEEAEATEVDTEVETVVQPEAEAAAVEEIAVETTAANDAAEIEVVADEETEQGDAALEGEAEVRYVMMNVPYRTFYAAYNLTDMAVWEVEDGIDAVSTATTSKFKGVTGLAKGTYNNGKYIMGVVIPVEVSAEAYEKLPKDLKENDNYAFTVLDEKPGAYSTLSIADDGSYEFSKLQEFKTDYVSVGEIDTSQDYGDYVIPLNGFLNNGSKVQTGEDTYAEYTVYGAVINTSDGKSFGMTCLENLWYGSRVPNLEIAASIIGGKGERRGHGNGDPFYQFEGLNGAELGSIDVITSLGIISVPANGAKLPEYYTGDLSALNFAVANGSDQLTISGVPNAFEDVSVSVSYGRGRNITVIADAKEIVDEKVTLDAETVDGVAYTVTINSSNYPAISRTVSTPIAESQKNELTALIEKAKLTIGYEENADLKEHVQEAEEMLANTAATSVDAASLIAELQEKIKAKDMASVEIGGLTYFYADTTDVPENYVYVATVSSRRGNSYYKFEKNGLKQLTGTNYYYTTITGVKPLTGTLYGYTGGTATNYKEVYAKLDVETDESYDAISSATKYTGHHAKDIPSLVTYGTDTEGDKAITGLTLGRDVVSVEADPYVEASILKAAEEALTEEQKSLIAVTLKVNPMDKPADSTITPVLSSAEYTSSRYGTGEFVIVPDDTVEGYVWSEYWNSVYAATISDGTTTVGAVHWIDLYGEAATSGGHYNKLQIALNNGTSIASNTAEVHRYAAFYDENNAFNDGTYTIKVYAEGYDVLEAEVKVTAKADQAAAANAEALIKAANGKFATAADAQKAVDAAKKAFVDLTDAQKAMLFASMSDAESQLAAAQTAATNQKNAEDAARNSGTGNKGVNNNTKTTQTVTKQSQSLKKLTPTTKKLKASKLKKKKQTFKLKATINGQGKVTFKKVSGNKKIKISKAGKVTVKKGLKKGTYKVKVKVSIAATGNYAAASTTKTIKIKVK